MTKLEDLSQRAQTALKAMATATRRKPVLPARYVFRRDAADYLRQVGLANYRGYDPDQGGSGGYWLSDAGRELLGLPPAPEPSAGPSFSTRAEAGVKVLVCGRERFTDRDFIHDALGRLDHERGPFSVVMQFGCGAGAGPASHARDWVWENGFVGKRCIVRTFTHDWDRQGPGAHHKTYDEILRNDPPDLVIVFGPEQGSHRPFVRRAREQGIAIIEFPFDETLFAAGRRHRAAVAEGTPRKLFGAPVDVKTEERLQTEMVIYAAEETYHKRTGRTRYDFTIDALQVLVDHLFMTDEPATKELLLAMADELECREGPEVFAAMRKRTEAAIAAFRALFAGRPHRRSAAAAAH